MSNFSCCLLFRSGISGIGMIHSDKHWYHSHLNGILKWFKTNLGRWISLAPKFSNFFRGQLFCYIFNIRSPFVISSHDLGDIVMLTWICGFYDDLWMLVTEFRRRWHTPPTSMESLILKLNFVDECTVLLSKFEWAFFQFPIGIKQINNWKQSMVFYRSFHQKHFPNWLN